MRWVLFFLIAATVAPPARAEPIEVRAARVALNTAEPARERIGALRYAGGLVLSSPDDRFGGLSGLLASRDGRRVTAVSDKGDLFRLDLVYGPNGALSGVAGTDVIRLTDNDGEPLEGGSRSDAESLAEDGAGGLLVAFERKHRIVRHAAPDAPAALVPLPPQLVLSPRNGGIEALARLADGRLLALSEGLRTDRGLMGWIGAPGAGSEADWQPLTYPYDGRNVPTGATLLPGGDVLVVERRYSPLEGLGTRLRRVPGRELTAGSLISGDILADLREPDTVDNFEGVAVFQGGDGALRVLLISDDNFSPLQRTLLLCFRLDEAR
jgi:hypothetical protein